MFGDYYKSVYLEGKGQEYALTSLLGNLVNAKVTPQEIREYLKTNLTNMQLKNFNRQYGDLEQELLDSKELNTQEIAYLIQNALAGSQTTGAHFLGCKAGLSIGIPLVASGIILAVIGVYNRTMTQKRAGKIYTKRYNRIQSKYAKKMQNVMDQYEEDSDIYASLMWSLEASRVEELRLLTDHFDADPSNTNWGMYRDYLDEKKSRGKTMLIISAIATGIGSVPLAMGISDCQQSAE
jgi:hypothetical protein